MADPLHIIDISMEEVTHWLRSLTIADLSAATLPAAFKDQLKRCYLGTFTGMDPETAQFFKVLWAEWKIKNKTAVYVEQLIAVVEDLELAGEKQEALDWMAAFCLYSDRGFMDSLSWVMAFLLLQSDYEQELPDDGGMKLGFWAALKSKTRGDLVERYDKDGKFYVKWWEFRMSGTAQGKGSDHIKGGKQLMQVLAVEVRGAFGTQVRDIYFRLTLDHLRKMQTTLEVGSTRRKLCVKYVKYHHILTAWMTPQKRSADPTVTGKVTAALNKMMNILGKLTGRSGRDSDPLNFIYTPGSPAVGNTAAVAPIPFQEAIAAEAIVQTAVEMVVDSPDRLCEVHLGLGASARPVVYRREDELRPISTAIVSKGHVARQFFSMYKWRLVRVGAGVVKVKKLRGQKGPSPAANNASKKYKIFTGKIRHLSGDTCTVWDFSKGDVKIETGVDLLHPDVYIVPPPAILNYDANQEVDAPAAAGDAEEVGADALMAGLSDDEGSDDE